MIGVISDHAARYTWFSQCLSRLGYDTDVVRIEWRVGANRGESRNSLVRACLERQTCDWLFFVDDDQVFQDDALHRLLDRDQPVVSALIMQRGAPFLPTAYATFQECEFQPLDLRSVGNHTLVRVAGVGSGGLLVRREVFEKLEDPWFVYTENFGEDLYFSQKCFEAEIPMFVDTGCHMGHLIPAAVMPAWFGDRWGVGIQLADGTSTAIELNHD
jgi:hypothetical protein